MNVVKVIPWDGSEPPTETVLRRRLDAEGRSYYKWGNDPFDTYAAHAHHFDKIIYVVSGSITFGLPADGRKLTLQAGDRLELPAGTLHDATVGVQGVECLEAHL